MDASPRADKGKPRKVTPEEVLEAINAALPHFHKKTPTKSALYRFCIEKGLLHAGQIALTTFCRFVREYELLKDDPGENRRRLAFSMQHANQLWQADTMFCHLAPETGSSALSMIRFLKFNMLLNLGASRVGDSAMLASLLFGEQAGIDVEVVTPTEQDVELTARAATLGAPQAIQVADRWHLLRNVQEALRKAIEPQSPAVNSALQATTDKEKNDGPNVDTTSASEDRNSVAEPAEPQSNNDPARRQRFERVVQLHQEGKSQ